MKNKLKKIILKWLYDTKALEFKTWKSQTRSEQYTSIIFLGKEIHKITWLGLEMLNKIK